MSKPRLTKKVIRGFGELQSLVHATLVEVTQEGHISGLSAKQIDDAWTAFRWMYDIRQWKSDAEIDQAMRSQSAGYPVKPVQGGGEVPK